MNPSAEFDIIVYGATGFTGQLIAEYLAARDTKREQIRWAMAGRSLDKLKRIRDAIRAPADTSLVVADASNPISLTAMLRQTRSVISNVGPYQLHGSDLVAGCAASGIDYFDLCGEVVWMRQMIDQHEAAAKASGARIVFSGGFDSVPFELGTFFVQEEARRVFGAPASRVKGRVRRGTLALSGGTVASARATFEAVARDLSLVAILKDPFALTPGFKGVKQPPANKVVYEKDLESWAAPFTMATLNTRNVHRSNMLMGFPYGTEFVYDEMVLTGPGGKGEVAARDVVSANSAKTGPGAPKSGEGPTKEEREAGSFDLLYIAISPDGHSVRASVRGNRDSYGSTAKIVSECAMCLLHDTPDLPAGIWTPGAAMQQRLIKRLVDHTGLIFEVEN